MLYEPFGKDGYRIIDAEIYQVILSMYLFIFKYTVSQEFPDSVKNMLLLKNLQFLPDHYETLTKEGTHEDLILTKFRNDPVKIVDFLVKAYF